MLRPYQIQALAEIRSHYARGEKKVLYWAATGAGKTTVFSEILKSCYEKKKNALMVVRGRKLVKQASQRLAREYVPHGIMMANNDRGHHHRIKICSIDTLRARRLRPDADLIVIDEAHLATSDSYVEFLKDYPEAFLLPVTATPFGSKPLRHCANVIVSTISMRELTTQGYLVPAKFFAPTETDLSGVQIQKSTGDYNQRELGNVMDKSKLVGDLVRNWEAHGGGRPTVCFAVTVAHSQHIASQFNAAGIPAVHCDADSPDDYREHCISRLERGDIKVLTNVGIFGLGVDMPFVSCLILARPTQSLSLYIQQVGRGLRTSENKNECLIFDHAGNVLRHGFPTQEFTANLDGKKTIKKKFRIMRCDECFAVVERMPCTECGHTPERNDRSDAIPNQVDGELREITEVDLSKNIKKDIEKWTSQASHAGMAKGWIWHKCKDKYGVETAKFYLSDLFRST